MDKKWTARLTVSGSGKAHKTRLVAVATLFLILIVLSGCRREEPPTPDPTQFFVPASEQVTLPARDFDSIFGPEGLEEATPLAALQANATATSRAYPGAPTPTKIRPTVRPSWTGTPPQVRYIPRIEEPPINPRKGVAWAFPSEPSALKLNQDFKVATGLNWSARKTAAWPAWFEHVPMYYTDSPTGLTLMRSILKPDEIVQVKTQTGTRTTLVTHCRGCRIYFLNEPDNSDPNASIKLTPQQCADAYWNLRQLYSQAEIIGPMVLNWHQGHGIAGDFGLDYVRECVRLATIHGRNPKPGTPPKLTMSIHMYHAQPRLGSPGIKFCKTAAECTRWLVNHVCNYAASVWKGPCQVYVTEYGTCNPAGMEAMTNTFAADSRVRRFYAFAPFWHLSNDCLKFYTERGGQVLTEVGKAFARSGNTPLRADLLNRPSLLEFPVLGGYPGQGTAVGTYTPEP